MAAEYNYGNEALYSNGGLTKLWLGENALTLHPDEARLLGLRLIREADKADEQEW